MTNGLRTKDIVKNNFRKKTVGQMALGQKNIKTNGTNGFRMQDSRVW